jgi:dienelactone hydrolase
MSISFTCPACGKAFTVSDGLAGKKAKCKQCGGIMIVPGTAASAKPPNDLYDFEDAPDPLPPRASAAGYAPKATGESNKKKAVRPDAKKAGAAGTGVILGLVALRLIGWAIRSHRQEGPDPGATAPAPVASVPVSTQPWTMPVLPERAPMREFQPGVMFQEIRIGPGRPAPGLLPAHGMTLYFYLPPGDHAPGSLPCVLIAPAGSILITGMDLGAGDQAEHLPYVRAGFAVLSYSLDGHVPDLKSANNAQIRQAALQFLAARAGLTNAKVALEWLTARVPEVDANRIYAAGHSSAATMAILLAENESRIKKCAAFAPRVDVETNFPGPQKDLLRRLIPGVDAFFTTFNPKHHADKITCPILLFHARDDSVVPVAESESFASSLQALGKDVSLETVPSGNHYESMIRQGIPKAIAWFNGEDPATVASSVERPMRPAPRGSNAPAVDAGGAPNRRLPRGPQMNRPGSRPRPGRARGPQ